VSRLPALDLPRGIAVMMILPVNIALFSGAIDMMGGGQRGPATWLDYGVKGLSQFFFEAKFITMLSVLFGAGLSLQISRSRLSEGAFTAYYLRRMAILLAIGFAHALFLWFGDILTSYAIVAVGALFVSRMPTRAILAVIASCLIWFVGCSLAMLMLVS